MCLCVEVFGAGPSQGVATACLSISENSLKTSLKHPHSCFIHIVHRLTSGNLAGLATIILELFLSAVDAKMSGCTSAL